MIDLPRISQRQPSTAMPACPICHQSKSVASVPELYKQSWQRGDRRLAPPAPPRERSFLLWPITVGGITETVTLIAVMLLCASGQFTFLQYALAVVGICIPLLLSGYGFARLLTAEQQKADLLEWEKALDTWNHSFICTADQVIFTPAEQPQTRQPADRQRTEQLAVATAL
ncbi:MAG: hypothetical protein IRZ31_09685 [Thermogemmatispora sp.]|uniref:hypothetical protein n=1 Tax=Thermogemmatispora sp. TaxID=1968838 RepID=UPI00260378E1|nr:hypothetical protein [Thermogemmatispora sp.]MBX5457161.1 hypothetical protein [Thermogemmatispora sp.]